MTDVELFISESVRHARTLPVGDSIKYLAGMLYLGNEARELSPVRQAFNSLTQCDQQLELIASGQLRFSLPEAAPKKGSRK